MLRTLTNTLVARERRAGKELSAWAVRDSMGYYDYFNQELSGIRDLLLNEQRVVGQGGEAFFSDRQRGAAYQLLQENNQISGILQRIEQNTRGNSSGRQE